MSNLKRLEDIASMIQKVFYDLHDVLSPYHIIIICNWKSKFNAVCGRLQKLLRLFDICYIYNNIYKIIFDFMFRPLDY